MNDNIAEMKMELLKKCIEIVKIYRSCPTGGSTEVRMYDKRRCDNCPIHGNERHNLPNDISKINIVVKCWMKSFLAYAIFHPEVDEYE
jgi:hypothetical protein